MMTDSLWRAPWTKQIDLPDRSTLQTHIITEVTRIPTVVYSTFEIVGLQYAIGPLFPFSSIRYADAQLYVWHLFDDGFYSKTYARLLDVVSSLMPVECSYA